MNFWLLKINYTEWRYPDNSRADNYKVAEHKEKHIVMAFDKEEAKTKVSAYYEAMDYLTINKMVVYKLMFGAYDMVTVTRRMDA